MFRRGAEKSGTQAAEAAAAAAAASDAFERRLEELSERLSRVEAATERQGRLLAPVLGSGSSSTAASETLGRRLKMLLDEQDLVRRVTELERELAEAIVDGARQAARTELARSIEELEARLRTDCAERMGGAAELGVRLEQAAADVTAQGAELQRLREALSGDCGRYLRFLDEERQRSNDLTVEGDHAEWLVRDVPAWRETLPRGKALESPEFAVVGAGGVRFSGLRLRFFPRGGPHATGDDTCSVYLQHPPEMPWAQYELSLGSQVRSLDALYGGGDDFCELTPELAEVDGARCAYIAVRILPPSRRVDTTAGFVGTRAASASSPRAPTAGELWMSSNRLDSVG